MKRVVDRSIEGSEIMEKRKIDGIEREKGRKAWEKTVIRNKSLRFTN